MQIQGSVALPGGRAEMWNLLLDPAVLEKCIPGCEKLESTGPDQYRADLAVGVAAIKGKYSGLMTITNKRPPEAFQLQVSGQGAPGWVKAVMNFELAAQGQETVLHYQIDAQVGGLIASVGQRMLGGVAKMLLGEMFKGLRAQAEALER